jgi:hypothetical protein
MAAAGSTVQTHPAGEPVVRVLTLATALAAEHLNEEGLCTQRRRPPRCGIGSLDRLNQPRVDGENALSCLSARSDEGLDLAMAHPSTQGAPMPAEGPETPAGIVNRETLQVRAHR